MSTDSVPGSTVPGRDVAARGTWRSVLVVFGPSILLDLLLAASVIATALDKQSDPRQGRIARLLRRGTTASGASSASSGGISALDASGNLATFERPVVPLLVIAVVTIAALIMAHSRLLNQESGRTPSRVR